MTTAAAPVVAVENPATAQVAQEATDLVAVARALTVQNDDDYRLAASFLTEKVKPLLRQIDDTFDPIVTAAHRAHKTALEAKKKVADPVLAAERTVKGALSTYTQRQEQERRRLEEQIRKAEQERAEREALERAAELERQGHHEEAEAMTDQLIAAPPPAPPVVLPPATPKVAGVSTRENWQYRIVDASKIRPEFMTPDLQKIGGVVRSMKGAAAQVVGGIEVYNQPTVSAR